MLKVQHSIVSPEALLNVIQGHYPATGVTHCELLELGCNDNYRLKGKRKDYAFRLCRLGWWPENEFDEELRFLQTLRRKGVNVCKPVLDMNKSRYIKIEAAEGLRYGALFDFIPGRHLASDFGPRNKNLLQLGALVAQMHSAADSIKQPIQRWTIGFDNVVTQFLQNAPDVLGHREKDLKYLHKLADRLEDVILGQPDNAFDFGLCHGDLHLNNVMLQADGDLTIFDFDLCAYSWRVYDIATVWWSLSRNPKSRQQLQAFLRGYTQYRRLSKEEKALLPWFVVFRHFEYLNFQLSMRQHLGSAWFGDHYYDFHLKFFKNWTKEHLNY